MARSISFPLASRGLSGTNYRRLCNSRVGVYLRERRDALGLTQAALAKQLDVSNPKISSWETGKDPLPPERYADIARILDFDVYTFSKVILRYSNPHLFDIMFPGEDPTIKDELSQLESRVFIPYGGEPSNQ